MKKIVKLKKKIYDKKSLKLREKSQHFFLNEAVKLSKMSLSHKKKVTLFVKKSYELWGEKVKILWE